MIKQEWLKIWNSLIWSYPYMNRKIARRSHVNTDSWTLSGYIIHFSLALAGPFPFLFTFF